MTTALFTCGSALDKIDFPITQPYPKLVDLYKTLCGNTNWKQEHRALDDVDKCAQCYFKLSIV